MLQNLSDEASTQSFEFDNSTQVLRIAMYIELCLDSNFLQHYFTQNCFFAHEEISSSSITPFNLLTQYRRPQAKRDGIPVGPYQYSISPQNFNSNNSNHSTIHKNDLESSKLSQPTVLLPWTHTSHLESVNNETKSPISKLLSQTFHSYSNSFNPLSPCNLKNQRKYMRPQSQIEKTGKIANFPSLTEANDTLVLRPSLNDIAVALATSVDQIFKKSNEELQGRVEPRDWTIILNQWNAQTDTKQNYDFSLSELMICKEYITPKVKFEYFLQIF